MFIVLEGIDGAGKGRQRNELVAALGNKVTELYSTDFPDHKGILYKELIKPALLEKVSLNKSAWFLSFVLDQIMFQDKISLAKGSQESFFICDGYYTTTLVYQCLVSKYIKLKTALNFASDFGLQPADINIFIDVDPKVAQERKMKEEGHDEGLDINERNLQKQYLIRDGFLELAKGNIFGHWEIVDGNGPIAQVGADIIKVLIKGKYLNY